MININRAAVRYILEQTMKHPEDFDWRLHGFGVFQLYLPDEHRIHLWSHKHAAAGVSYIHDHAQWKSFESTIMVGTITNNRYTEGSSTSSVPHLKQLISTGPNGGPIGSPSLVELHQEDGLIYTARHTYGQSGDWIHRTVAVDGTVSVIHRVRNTHDMAHVYYPANEAFGSAAPRTALQQEIQSAIKFSFIYRHRDWV